MEQSHNKDAWVMWHNAALVRSKEMAPLSDFMVVKKPVKNIDEDVIMARLKAYQKERAK